MMGNDQDKGRIVGGDPKDAVKAMKTLILATSVIFAGAESLSKLPPMLQVGIQILHTILIKGRTRTAAEKLTYSPKARTPPLNIHPRVFSTSLNAHIEEMYLSHPSKCLDAKCMI